MCGNILEYLSFIKASSDIQVIDENCNQILKSWDIVDKIGRKRYTEKQVSGC